VRAAALREKHDGDLADHSSVRLWLRLLSCTMVIEKRVKRRFADRFSTTLPRFDVLAALDRTPGGLTMTALSGMLLVSNGNVTALVQTLVKDGMVTLTPSPTDRRASIVRLTDTGAAHFAELAEAHHHWIDDMLAGLSRQQREMLFDLLGALKLSIAAGDRT
jgi:DNA-binding MarR family transcriptional regulator